MTTHASRRNEPRNEENQARKVPQEMRRIDLFVGRLAAVVGIVYVALVGFWPLTASAADEAAERQPFVVARSLPRPSPVVPTEVRLAGAIADVTAGRTRRQSANRAIEALGAAPSVESLGMLLVAAGVFGGAVLATLAGAALDGRERSSTARSACRRRPAAAA